MDSKQLVNDIVNKRFSKARDTIREELADRIIANVESMVPEVAPEVIHEKLGIVKGVAGVIGAKSLIGKALKGRFSKKGRDAAKEKKSAKLASKKAKNIEKASRIVKKELLKLRQDLDNASEADAKEINAKIVQIKDKAEKNDIPWKAQPGERKFMTKDEIKADKERESEEGGKTGLKVAKDIKSGKNGSEEPPTDTEKPTDDEPTDDEKSEPTVDVDAIKQKIEDKQKEIAEIRAELTKLVDKGTGDRSEEDDAKIENHNQSIAQREEEIGVLKKQLPQDTEEDKTE